MRLGATESALQNLDPPNRAERRLHNELRPVFVGRPSIVIGKMRSLTISGNPASRKSNIFPLLAVTYCSR